MKKTIQSKKDTLLDGPPLKTHNPNNYMDKKEVHIALTSWLKEVEQAKIEGLDKRPVLPDIVAKAIIDVANNLSRVHSYRNYSWREDMVAKAILNMVDKADKYNPDREDANPYAFFSIITEKNTFWEYIPRENKQNMLLKKYRLETQDIDTLTNGDMNSSVENSQQSSNNSNALTMELYTQEVAEVAQFDKKLEDKKKARKARLEELKKEKEGNVLDL